MSRLIVLEGLDGCGKSTQIKLLIEYFIANGIQHQYLHFPRLSSPYYGEMIARFLRGEFGSVHDVDPYLVALLYAGDRADANQQIVNWLNQGFVVLLDRYVYSNIAFQSAKVSDDIERHRLIHWIEELEFTHHQLVHSSVSIFLHTPYSILQQRLHAERAGDDRQYLNGKQDIHESSHALQARVEAQYLWLCENRDDLLLLPCYSGDTVFTPEIIHQKVLHLLGLRNASDGSAAVS